ncbi:MAG: hypothetical protein NVS1B11_10170 [Terriglobales bacterium]
MQLEIKNVGAVATIAEHFGVEVKCADGRDVHGTLYEFPGKEVLKAMAESVHVPLRIFDSGPIYVSSARAIQPGGIARGWLPIEIEGFKNGSELTSVGCNWIITFRDIHDKPYTATYLYSSDTKRGVHITHVQIRTAENFVAENPDILQCTAKCSTLSIGLRDATVFKFSP